jgi:hypothetical protein
VFSKKISFKLVSCFFLSNPFNFFLTLFFDSNINKNFATFDFDKFSLSLRFFEEAILKRFAKKLVKICNFFVNLLKVIRELKN